MQKGNLFFLFTHTGTKFITSPADAGTVLADKYKFAFFGYGNRVYPVGIFKNIIFGDMISIGKQHIFTTNGQPRAAEQVFAAHRFPCFVFLFHKVSCFLPAKVMISSGYLALQLSLLFVHTSYLYHPDLFQIFLSRTNQRTSHIE